MTDQEVQAVRAQVSTLQSRVARAQVEHDAAVATEDKARQDLVSEFGVETPEQGKAKLAELESAAEAALSELREAMAATSNGG